MDHHPFKFLLQTLAGFVCQLSKSICVVFLYEVLSANLWVLSEFRMSMFYKMNPIFHILLFFFVTPFTIINMYEMQLNPFLCVPNVVTQPKTMHFSGIFPQCGMIILRNNLLSLGFALQTALDLDPFYKSDSSVIGF